MTGVQHHIIRRQVLEVDVAGDESDGLALQRRLPGLCQEWLIPSLEVVLGRLVPGDEHWTIDRLDIDAGSFHPEAFERGLIDAVTRAVELYILEHAPRMGVPASPKGADRRRKATAGIGTMDGRAGEREPSGAMGRRTEAQSLQAAFLHFLETGVLPWWLYLPQGRTLEDLIRASWQVANHGGGPQHFARAVIDAIGSATARTRLVRQFSRDFLETLLAAISPECASAVRDVMAALAQTGIATRVLEGFSEQLWQTAFVMAVSGERPAAEALIAETLATVPVEVEWRRALPVGIVELWSGMVRDGSPGKSGPLGRDARGAARTPVPKALPQRTHRDEAVPPVDLDEGVYVNCAGVVLLHPFLPRLFEAVGIAKDGELQLPERALCLMHFLATGQRFAPEYDLTLPKLLCNVPVGTPVEARIELTAAEEEESAALLAAVIGHWDALGDTSADGLRGGFLVRPGKLSRRGGDDVLQVEPRTFDILLDRLPWGIGTVRLPWMERTLWVEWGF